jgi:hypothetical protein
MDDRGLLRRLRRSTRMYLLITAPNRWGASTNGGLSGYRGLGQHLHPTPVCRQAEYASAARFLTAAPRHR